MIRKQRLCHDSLFKSIETKNVIELSAFSKSLSKKITYLNHEERILIDIEQIAAITPSSEREDLPKKNSTVGRRLTDEEFVNMYPSQCNIFKEIFKREFQVASQKIQKTKR